MGRSAGVPSGACPYQSRLLERGVSRVMAKPPDKVGGYLLEQTNFWQTKRGTKQRLSLLTSTNELLFLSQNVQGEWWRLIAGCWMMQGGAWGGVRYGRWMGRWVVVGGSRRKEGGRDG